MLAANINIEVNIKQIALAFDHFDRYDKMRYIMTHKQTNNNKKHCANENP